MPGKFFVSQRKKLAIYWYRMFILYAVLVKIVGINRKLNSSGYMKSEEKLSKFQISTGRIPAFCLPAKQAGSDVCMQ